MKSYKLIGILPIFLLAIIFVSVIPSVSSDSGAINTFLNYEDAPTATSKTVTQGDSVNLILIAYGHGEQLSYEKLELVSSTLIFQESVLGTQVTDYTWLYSKVYTLNTGILTPGTYTLRFTAKTKVTQSVEYSELQLTILPKITPPVCGDGKKEGTEQCDYGTSNGNVCSPLYGSSCTYCSNSCTLITLQGPYCGNGKLETGEQCDDGNKLNNDGCSSTCKLEICGDNIKQSNEGCDLGVLNGQVCSPLYGSSCTYCSDSCTLITLKGPYCGDGIKQSNEQCDDGNKVNGDGCSSTCQTETPKECILQLTKSADKTNLEVGDTVIFTLKYKNIGTGLCTGGGVKVQDVLNSNLDFITYTKSVTGDSDSQGLTLGYYEIPSYDSSTNTLTFNAHKVSPGEEGIIMIAVKILEPSQCGDFQIANYFKVWSNEKGWQSSNIIKVYVDNDCPPTQVCGNNLKETGEECDYGSSNGKICSPLYGSSCTYCSGSCKLISLTGPYCGDGVKQSNEQCDDGNKVNGDGCSSTCTIEETKECILQLTKTSDKTNVQPGEIVTFTLKYKNIGTGVCTGGGVKIQDVLNSNLDFITYTKSVTGDSDSQGLTLGYYEIPSYDSSTNTLTFNAHTVSPGEEGTIKITAKVLEPAQCGDFQISNYFKLWSNEKGWQNSNAIKVYVDNDCPPTQVCGNNLKETGEECDYGSLNGQVCSPLYGSSCTYCSNSCKLITLKGPYCGDNVKQPNEGCDLGVLNGQVCSPLYGSSCNYCSASCEIKTVYGGYCGNGKLETGEQCDDGNKVNGDGCSSICIIEETKECVIQLTKSVDRTNLQPGEIVTFTLKYKNIGEGDCTGGGVKIQDVLNSNLKYMSYTKSLTGDSDSQGISYGYYEIPGYSESTNTLTWNAHKVSPGEEGIIKITAKVLEPAQCGDFQISNYFKLWSNEKGWQSSNIIKVYVDNDCYTPFCGNGIKDAGEECDDENTVNGDGCSSTCQTEIPKECILQLTKTSDKTNVQPGDIVTFTLKYKNIGDEVCTGGGVKVQDVLNSNLKYMSYTKSLTGDSDSQGLTFGYYESSGYVSSTNTLNFNAHIISPGEEGIINITVKVLEPSQCRDFQISNYFKMWTSQKGWENSNIVKLDVDCGECQEECTVCKDSRPLDDSDDESYYYYESKNNNPTGISGDVVSDEIDLNFDSSESALKKSLSLIIIALVLGILAIFVLFLIMGLSRR